MASILKYALEKSISQFLSPSLPPQDRAEVIDSETQSDDLSSTPKELSGFKPQYAIPIRRPKDDLQAQKLYNAIRTVAFYLDAIPGLGSKLPFGVGVDSILGLIPGIGDWMGLVLGLYQVFLCTLFGLPIELLGWMLLNVILDCAIGLVPIVGDLLDVAFKSNLRNLTLLESHLLERKGVCSSGEFSILIPPSDRFIPKLESKSGSKSWWWSKEAPIPAGPAGIQPHRGRRTRPISSRTAQRQREAFQQVPTTSSSYASGTRPSPSSRVNPSEFEGSRFTELDPEEEATSTGIRSRTIPGDFHRGESDSHSSSLHSTLRMTLPKGIKEVPVMSREGILISSGSETTSNPHLSTSREESTNEEAQEINPYIINDLSDSTPMDTSTQQHQIDHNQHLHPSNDSQIACTHSINTEEVDDDPSTEQVEVLPILHSGTTSRRGVSWYEGSIDASPSFSRAKERSRDPSDQEIGLEGYRHSIVNKSASEVDALINRQVEGSGFSRRGRTPRSHLENKTGSSGRKLIIIYAAIFCVSYTTSLDLSTSYLYLNFACSEYGSLASFSTVSIVQQMVFALGKPPLAKLSDVSGRFTAFSTSIFFYSSGYLLVSLSTSLSSLLVGMVLQSLGFTGVQTLISIIIADTATARWRGLVLAVVNLPYLINFAFSGMLVDAVMDPKNDGIMRHWNGWRLGFGIWAIVVPISALPLLFTLHLGQKKAAELGLSCRDYEIREGEGDARRSWIPTIRQWMKELDVLGLLLLSIGGGLVLLPITLAGRREESRVSSLPLFPIGVISLVLFLIWESKASYPVMPYRFFKNRAVICVCFIGLVDFASFSLSWTFLSSFVQVVKGWEQRRTGYFAMTQNVSSTLIGILAGSIMASTQRFKSLLVIGVIIRLIGVSLMIQYRNAGDTFLQVLCQVLQGIGGGFIAITMQVAAQISVRHSDVASVTALELLTTEVGAASGSALAGYFFNNHLPEKLQENLPQLTSKEVSRIFGSLEVALSYPLGSSIRTGIISSWVSLMHLLCISATIVLVPALIFALSIPNYTLHDAAKSHHLGRRRSSGSSLGRKSSLRSRRTRSRSRNSRTEHSYGGTGSEGFNSISSQVSQHHSLSKYGSHSVSPKSERRPLPDFA